jgi:hypothetical protein
VDGLLVAEERQGDRIMESAGSDEHARGQDDSPIQQDAADKSKDRQNGESENAPVRRPLRRRPAPRCFGTLHAPR